MAVEKKRCSRCGRRIKKGGIAYRLKAELISSFDGYLTINERANMHDLLEELKESFGGLSAKELEEQVYKLHEYMICTSCRDEIDRFLSMERPG
jgi:hypothetical protein